MRHLSVAVHIGAEFAILLAAQRDNDLVAGPQNIIVHHRAGLRHRHGRRLADLVITELLQTHAARMENICSRRDSGSVATARRLRPG